MSLFNRFIESIIPAPDRDDDLLPPDGDQLSPTRRSTRTIGGYRRESEGTVGNGLAYARKS